MKTLTKISEEQINNLSTELVRIIEEVTGESGFDPDTILMSILKRDPIGWNGAGIEVANVIARRYGLSQDALVNVYLEDDGDKTHMNKKISDIAEYIEKNRTK